MFKAGAGLGSLGVALGLATAFAFTADAAPPAADDRRSRRREVDDDLPNPEEDKRRELREAAIKQVLAGKRAGPGIATAARSSGWARRRPRRAPPPRTSTSSSRARRPTRSSSCWPSSATSARPTTRTRTPTGTSRGRPRSTGRCTTRSRRPTGRKDNKTIWQPDYNADHYRQLYFGTGDGVESLKTYYERQSSGRYSVDGEVTDWVKVRYNEARYGRSDGYPCPTNVCSNTWDLIKDAIDTWVADQHAKGRTDEQIKADLASYDQWDRNDFDHDGNFNEPDGYIDHFQIVHSGGDQADADPNQGEDAIWSHRWKAFQNTGQGPAGNKDGGTQVGTTGLWVADYTIQPENGGISVFAHEYGHDLGLPDEYDTAGDNAVNWWTLMAQSRTSAAADEGIGTRAADLGAWDKLQLGWLDYEIVVAGQNKTLDLGPHEGNTAKAQGVVRRAAAEDA